MSLKITKETNLTGTSVIKGVTVATFQASVRTDAAQSGGYIQDTTTTTINAPDVYAQNRVEVRKDTAAFNEVVYEIQDAYIGESESEAEANVDVPMEEPTA